MIRGKSDLKIRGNIDVELNSDYVQEQYKLFFEEKSTIKESIINNLEIELIGQDNKKIIINNNDIEMLDIFTIESYDDKTVLKFIIHSKNIIVKSSDIEYFDKCKIELKTNLNIKNNNLKVVLN